MRWLDALRRGVDVARAEGAQGVLGRLARRASSDERKVFARYPAWARARDREAPPRAADPPLVSIVTPVKDPPLHLIRDTLRSVLAQREARVEWCVADDGSRPEVRRFLSGLTDPRVKVRLLEGARGISGATNAALELASGELIGFVDHDDVLHPDAVAWMQSSFVSPDVGAAYSDEDKFDRERFAPFLKPGFSTDLLQSFNYVAHFFVARHALVRRFGLRSAFDGAQDHDLALRIAEAARIVHVPRVLYHWRASAGSTAARPGAKPRAREAGRRAVEEALLRRGERARVEHGPWAGCYQVRRAGDPARVVFRDAGVELDRAAREELAAHALRPDVALAVPRVLDRGRLESAGLVLGFGRLAACPFRGRAAEDPGYFGLARATRDVSAAGAAFAVARDKLDALGGWPRDVAEGHHGLALALRARDAGLRTVLAGEAVARRRSPGPRETPGDVARARAALGDRLLREPHLSPHFRRGRERLEL